jgi:hypothetical protein
MPGAGIADGHHGAAVHGAQGDVDLSLQGVLEGVREQVEDDLLPEVAVDVDRLRERRSVDHQPQAGSLHGLPEGARQLRRIGGEIDRLEDRLDAPGLDPREVEQGVDQLQQPLAVAVDQRQQLPALPRGPGEEVVERPQHEGERGAELVTDVREERRLGAVELGQSLGPLALFLVGLGVGDAGGDLRRHQAEESAVVVVEQPERVEADDQDSGPSGLT